VVPFKGDRSSDRLPLARMQDISDTPTE